VSVASDKEIVAAVAQLRAEIDARKQRSDSTDPAGPRSIS
jgi:hypothetical protein